MMCDNLSLATSTTILPQNQSTTMNAHFFPIHDEDDEEDDRPYMSVKRKLSGLYNKDIVLRIFFFLFVPLSEIWAVDKRLIDWSIKESSRDWISFKKKY